MRGSERHRSLRRPSDARVAELRGYRLIREMQDEIDGYDREPALRSPLMFALRTGEIGYSKYEQVRAGVRERRDLLERRIARVRVLAGLPPDPVG
jgi:hypothetical protein